VNIAIRLFLLTASPVILGITGCGAVSSSCTDTLEPFRTESESFFLTADASPFSEEFRKEFSGLSFFEANEIYCVDSSFELDEQSETVDYPAFNNKTIPFRQFGTFYFEIDGKPQSLVAHQRMDLPEEERQWLLIMFRDLTNGDETYGGGRYIQVDLPVSPGTKIDFNRATNPYCAYEAQFTCPVPPLENWLKVRLPAGEKDYARHGATGT
jgi:uncharacterized protein (DUF1684 family)